MVDKARELIETHHADVDVRNNQGLTALHLTAIFNYKGICRELLEHKADVNMWDGWANTPLHRAADRGHESICRLLLQHGADPDIENCRGVRPRDCKSPGTSTPMTRIVQTLLAEMGTEAAYSPEADNTHATAAAKSQRSNDTHVR